MGQIQIEYVFLFASINLVPVSREHLRSQVQQLLGRYLHLCLYIYITYLKYGSVEIQFNMQTFFYWKFVSLPRSHSLSLSLQRAHTLTCTYTNTQTQIHPRYLYSHIHSRTSTHNTPLHTYIKTYIHRISALNMQLFSRAF